MRLETLGTILEELGFDLLDLGVEIRRLEGDYVIGDVPQELRDRERRTADEYDVRPGGVDLRALRREIQKAVEEALERHRGTSGDRQ